MTPPSKVESSSDANYNPSVTLNLTRDPHTVTCQRPSLVLSCQQVAMISLTAPLSAHQRPMQFAERPLPSSLQPPPVETMPYCCPVRSVGGTKPFACCSLATVTNQRPLAWTHPRSPTRPHRMMSRSDRGEGHPRGVCNLCKIDNGDMTQQQPVTPSSSST